MQKLYELIFFGQPQLLRDEYRSSGLAQPFIHSAHRKRGLANNQASCFVQDQNGVMWISSINGLSRYDDKKNKNFYFYGNKKDIPYNNIRDMHALDNNLLLMLASSKVAVFDTKTEETVYKYRSINAAFKPYMLLQKVFSLVLQALKKENKFNKKHKIILK